MQWKSSRILISKPDGKKNNLGTKSEGLVFFIMTCAKRMLKMAGWILRIEMDGRGP